MINYNQMIRVITMKNELCSTLKSNELAVHNVLR